MTQYVPKVLISLIVLIIGLIGMTLYQNHRTRPIQSGKKAIQLTIIKSDQGFKKTIHHQTQATLLGEVLDELKIATYKNNVGGRLVVGLDHLQAKSKDAWWLLEINGKSSDTGVDATHIHDGDQVVFTYKVGW